MHALPARIALVLSLALASTALADDPIKAMQDAYVANKAEKTARAYHWGSQGPDDVFSNHTSHSNRLIPVYAFGKKVDLGAVSGSNSIYRNEAAIARLYGTLPPNTVNPDAQYFDQSDLYKVQKDAAAKGAKYIFTVWFDGMDWQTTQAAAIVKTGKVYTEGKGAGLIFQDFDADGTAQFGFCVTSPTHDKNDVDVDLQTVKIPAGSTARRIRRDDRRAEPLDPRAAQGPRLSQGAERQRRRSQGRGGRESHPPRLHRQLLKRGRVRHRGQELQQRRERRRGREIHAHALHAIAVARLEGGHGRPASRSTTPRPPPCTRTTSSATTTRTSPATCSASSRSPRKTGRSRSTPAWTWSSAPASRTESRDADFSKSQGKNAAIESEHLHHRCRPQGHRRQERRQVRRLRPRKPDVKGGPALQSPPPRRPRRPTIASSGSTARPGGHLPYRTADGDYKPAVGIRGSRELYTPETLDREPLARRHDPRRARPSSARRRTSRSPSSSRPATSISASTTTTSTTPSAPSTAARTPSRSSSTGSRRTATGTNRP